MEQKSKKSFFIASIQLFGTLAIMFLVQNTVLATILLLLWWLISFYPLSKHDAVLFLTTSVFFTIVDISVLQQGVFSFADKDIWNMPYFELFLWGFYFLHASRYLQGKASPRLLPGLIFSGLVMASLSYGSTIAVSLSVTFGVLLASLIYFGTKKDIQYMLYFVGMGLVIETLGTSTGKWTYAIDHYFAWWVITWAVSGVVLYRMSLPLTNKILSMITKK